MSNKTLIIGDMHIGKGLRMGKPSVDGSLNSRIVDQVKILNWILDTGIHHNINRFILTGDIFDEIKPDTNLAVIFIDWLKSCVNYGIECHIIAGNHDLKRVGSKYSSILDIIEASELHDVYIYNRIYTLHTKGVSFTLVPFRDKRGLNVESVGLGIEDIMSRLAFEQADIPFDNISVLVGHLSLEGSFHTDEIDDLSSELMIPLHYFSDFDYVWMGHVHKPQVMRKSNPYIAHIGSMDLSDFGETEQEKIVVLFDPELKNKFKQIVIPTRPLRRIRVSIPEKSDPTNFILNHIENVEEFAPFDNSIVKIEIKILNPNAPELNRDKILSTIYGLGAYHVCSFSESKNVSIVPQNKKHIKDSAIEPKAAVKLFADGILNCEKEERNSFINLCNGIINEYESSKK